MVDTGNAKRLTVESREAGYMCSQRGMVGDPFCHCGVIPLVMHRGMKAGQINGLNFMS